MPSLTTFAVLYVIFGRCYGPGNLRKKSWLFLDSPSLGILRNYTSLVYKGVCYQFLPDRWSFSPILPAYSPNLLLYLATIVCKISSAEVDEQAALFEDFRRIGNLADGLIPRKKLQAHEERFLHNVTVRFADFAIVIEYLAHRRHR